MQRVQISALITGETLEGPLYDRNRKLLLAKGLLLTDDMVDGLVNTGIRYAYLGEWNPDDLEDEVVDAGEADRPPLAECGDLADLFADELKTAVDSLLDAQETLEVLPDGVALDAAVDNSLQTNRSQERLREWKNIGNDTTQLVDDVLRGSLDEGAVAEASHDMVDRMLQAFADDKSLVANLTNIKGEKSYLCSHSANVSILSINIANELKYSKEQVREIGQAALLQDIGMRMVPQRLVDAPRKLTTAEFVDIQKHSIHAMYAISRMDGLPLPVQFVAYQNHERIDGSGYPRRHQRNRIHRYSQIVSVADTFDALTSNRPWRRAYHPYRAMEFIVRQASEGLFSGEVVRGLLHCISLYPLGCLVELSTGEIARVIHSNRGDIDRPVVAVLVGSGGQKLKNPETIDLVQDQNRRVEGVVEKPMRLGWNQGF